MWKMWFRKETNKIFDIIKSIIHTENDKKEKNEKLLIY